MTDDDYRLRALELAVDQARREQVPTFREAVADLQTWFYHRIKGEVTEPGADKPQAGRKARGTGKSPEIFR